MSYIFPSEVRATFRYFLRSAQQSPAIVLFIMFPSKPLKPRYGSHAFQASLWVVGVSSLVVGLVHFCDGFIASDQLPDNTELVVALFRKCHFLVSLESIDHFEMFTPPIYHPRWGSGDRMRAHRYVDRFANALCTLHFGISNPRFHPHHLCSLNSNIIRRFLSNFHSVKISRNYWVLLAYLRKCKNVNTYTCLLASA